MAASDLVLAFTGASGAPYGVRLLEVLLQAGRLVHLTLSPAAAEVLEQEMDRRVHLERFALADLLGTADPAHADRVEYHHYRDFRAGIASGSFLTGGTILNGLVTGPIWISPTGQTAAYEKYDPSGNVLAVGTLAASAGISQALRTDRHCERSQESDSVNDSPILFSHVYRASARRPGVRS